MKPEIRRMDAFAEFYTPEHCFINELANTPDDPGLSIARARVTPGIWTRWHRLVGIAERYIILEGEGLAEIGDLPPQKVGIGDVVIIPPECRQRITNIGEIDLVFLAVCTPRFQQDAYQDIEDLMNN